MQYKQIKIDSLINKITNKDTLFGGNFTIDPYQNCEFGCLYCDSSLDETIYIKTNSEHILKKELKQLEKGTIIVGSVHDPYQKAEEYYKITRHLLKIIGENYFSCHILTKSNLVVRDIDILSKIKNCKVTISLISLDKKILNIFEKNVPSSKKRLLTIQKLNCAHIDAGIAILPIIPYINEEEIEDIIKLAKDYNAKYILYKYLELKGNQKLCFFNILNEFYPNLIEKYKKLYKKDYMPDAKYISNVEKNIINLCKIYGLENKIYM